MSSKIESNKVNNLSKIFLNIKNKTSITYDLELDLDSDINKILSGFDYNTRSRIKKSSTSWKTNIYDVKEKNIKKNWKIFKNLHFNVSRRKTRSEKSWKLQLNSILSGNGFLVLLKDINNIVVGGAYFFKSMHEIYYAVSAYDRKLFKEPVGYNLQFEVIRYAKQNNIKTYRIGKLFTINDISRPDKKNLNISHFKKKFSSSICFKILHQI